MAGMPESEFQRLVIDLAHLYGWKVAHFRPAKTGKGWRTPVSADGQGFPDLVLARKGFRIFAELKVGKNQPGDKQQAWLKALGPDDPRTIVRCWWPKDWPEIKATIEQFGNGKLLAPNS